MKTKNKNGHAVSIWMSAKQHRQLVGLRKLLKCSQSAIVCATIDSLVAGGLKEAPKRFCSLINLRWCVVKRSRARHILRLAASLRHAR